MRGGEDKIEVIEEFVSSAFLDFFITDLTCHVVTLQSDVQVSYGYLI